MCGRLPANAESTRTLPSSGVIAFSNRRPDIRQRTKAASSKPTKPSFWNCSRVSAACRDRLADAGASAGLGAPATDQVAVLVVRDRSGQTADFHLEKLDTPHIIAVLRPLIEPGAILCSDGANVYKTFAREAGIAYRPINVQQGIRVEDGVFHIQNVNAYDSCLKTWMRRFRGVATKYLEHYLGWRRLLERYREAISPALCLNEAAGRWGANS